MKATDMITMCSNKCRANSKQVNYDFCPYHKRIMSIAAKANEIMGLIEFPKNGGDAHNLALAGFIAKDIKKIANQLF